MRKYIDNNLVIVIQQSKFPSLVNLMLIEASSGLSWSCNYEPKTEITSAGSFCLLDSTTVEKYFNSIYDSILPQEDQVFNYKADKLIAIDWNSINDTVP
jgi:hypothetical protein